MKHVINKLLLPVLLFGSYLLSAKPVSAAGSSCCCPDMCGSGYHCTSFLAGTKVRGPDGSETNIELLENGSSLSTFNPLNGRIGMGQIYHQNNHLVNSYYVLEAGNHNVKVTENHPFFVGADYVSKDPAVTRGYKRVDELSEGETIYILSNGRLSPVKIDSLKKIENVSVTVYTLSVTENENYFANGFAVHNKYCQADSPPSCQYSDQGCGANGCPPNTKRQCQNCGGGWSCSCNQDSACGPACNPNNWGGVRLVVVVAHKQMSVVEHRVVIPSLVVLHLAGHLFVARVTVVVEPVRVRTTTGRPGVLVHQRPLPDLDQTPARERKLKIVWAPSPEHFLTPPTTKSVPEVFLAWKWPEGPWRRQVLQLHITLRQMRMANTPFPLDHLIPTT